MSFTSARRDSRLIIGAKAVSFLGDLAAEVALVLRLQAHGAGAGAVAMLLIANLVPIVALSGVVGRLLDRHDNRRLVLAAALLQTGLCTVLAFTSTTWAILLLVALLGAGQSVNGAAWQALLPAAVGRDDLPAAQGRMQAASMFAVLVAPPLGGLLTGWYGARVPLLVDAGTFLLVAGAAVLIRTRRGVGAAPGAGTEGAAGTGGVAGAKLRGGAQIVWQDSLLRTVFVLLGVFALLASMVNVVEVFLVRETLGASTLWYGVAGASFGLGALVGALLGGRLRGPRALARGLVAATMLLSIGLGAIGLVPAVAWLLPLGILAGTGNGMMNVAVGSLIMGRAADDERGRVGALFSGVASATQLTAYALAGLLAGAFTPREIFVAAGLLGLCVPLLLGRGLVRTATSESTPAAAAPASLPAAA